MEKYENLIAMYGNPIFRYLVELSILEVEENFHYAATEYHVFSHANAIGGVIVYAKYKAGWAANPSSIILVSHLLKKYENSKS